MAYVCKKILTESLPNRLVPKERENNFTMPFICCVPDGCLVWSIKVVQQIVEHIVSLGSVCPAQELQIHLKLRMSHHQLDHFKVSIGTRTTKTTTRSEKRIKP